MLLVAGCEMKRNTCWKLMKNTVNTTLTIQYLSYLPNSFNPTLPTFNRLILCVHYTTSRYHTHARLSKDNTTNMPARQSGRKSMRRSETISSSTLTSFALHG